MGLNKFEKTELEILNILAENTTASVLRSKLRSRVNNPRFDKTLEYLYEKKYIYAREENISNAHFSINDNGSNLRVELLRRKREEQQLFFNKTIVYLTCLLFLGVIFTIWDRLSTLWFTKGYVQFGASLIFIMLLFIFLVPKIIKILK